MAGRWSAGPVFAFEWLTRSRRWQLYALRSVFVGSLLIGLAMVWQSTAGLGKLASAQSLASVGQQFFATLTMLQLALVLLAAPAATAGAICLDRARGSLTHVMVTDLSDAEVVLGKLAARLVPVLSLAACAVPVSALGMLMGGIDPIALVGSFAIASGVATLGCSLALLLSVWIARTHEVLTVVFAAWAAWLLSLPMASIASKVMTGPYWLQVTSPFWLTMAPYANPGETSLLEPALFTLGCLAISAALTALAVARLRPNCLGGPGRVAKAGRVARLNAAARARVRWARGPSLDGNPVLWREWHRARPSRWSTAVWWIYAAASSAASLWSIWLIRTDPPWNHEPIPMLVNGLQAVFGLLLVSASAATVLAEERVRGSLDVLLATPIRTRAILRGKWWGAFRRVPWLAFWPTAIMLAKVPERVAILDVGLLYAVPVLILGQGAALTSLGLALATWMGRVGRAVTWTITAFVASVIGWPIFAGMLPARVQADGTVRESMAAEIALFASPIVNLTLPAEMIGNYLEPLTFAAGLAFWAVAYPTIAALLYLATVLTFDRRLGRSPEKPRKAPAGPVPGAVRGWGWRIPGAGGRRPVGAASFGPPPR